MKQNLAITLLFLSTLTMLCACSTPDNTDLSASDTLSAESTVSEDTAPPAVSVDTEADELPYYGTWAIKDHQAAEFSALSTDETNAFLDYTITYQNDAVYQNEQKMDITEFSYESEPYTEESLVQDYHANLGEWWNGIGEVTHVSITTSETFFGDQFFVADDETLWIYYEGVFFIAKKE